MEVPISSGLTAWPFSVVRGPLYNGVNMTKITKSKLLTAVVFFTLGYMSNGLFDRVRDPGPVNVEGVERYPVNPDDFDTRKMIEAMKDSESSEWSRPKAHADSGASIIGEITQREDDKFVYFEIPVNQSANTSHELKVEIREGILRIAEVSKSKDGDASGAAVETNAERMFTIDPSLDSALAEVLDQKNKVLIKIPKRRI